MKFSIEYFRGKQIMRFIVNKLLLIGSLGLMLGACSTATDAEGMSENTPEETTVEAVNETEEPEERSIVANEITKTFYPEVTKLRSLTAKDLEWYDIIMTRLNAIDDYSGDRETVYEIAEEHNEDPEDLWFRWLEIVDAKWHGDIGDYAVLGEDLDKLFSEIIEKNIVGENVERIDGRYKLPDDEENLTTSGNWNLDVDGESYAIGFVIEHKDDFNIAELIKLSIDGVNIDF